MITVEQIVNTQKTHADTFFGLSAKAFEGVEKLVELNLSAAQAAIAEAARTAQLALSAKDPQELVALQSSLIRPAAEKAAAYGRYVYEIAAAHRRRSLARRRGASRRSASQIHGDRRHGGQERAGRQRERRRPDQVGGCRGEQRHRDGAEGGQASR